MLHSRVTFLLRQAPTLPALFLALLAPACSNSTPKAADSGPASADAGDSGTLASTDAGAADAAAEAAPPTLSTPWDWSGVIGTGQSLAVGQMGMPIQARTQPYHNLKLSTLGVAPTDAGTPAWPINPNDPSLMMVPLVEPIGRLSQPPCICAPGGYPSAYPTNIAGETPHAAMANEITSLVMAAGGKDYIGVHGEFGENGQGIEFLAKNPTVDTQYGVRGHAYAGTLFETAAINRLAQAQGKTYGVGAIIVTHGESDAGNSVYETQLYQLLTDYNTDIAAITGQTQRIQMILSQQNSINDSAVSTILQWKIGVDHPTDVVCSGPKYQYPYYSDTVHLITDGYEQLGEKYGQVYFERVVLGNPWQPLQPTSADRTGNVITVHFHVPVPPLVWDAVLPPPNQAMPAWSAGKGFEVRSGGAVVTISSVAIVGNDVQITCASAVPAGVTVSYAMTAGQGADGGTGPAQVTDASGKLLWTGTVRWGQLRDSDPFVGSMTKKAQANYAVAFQMNVP
jgi:hypothetical protein